VEQFCKSRNYEFTYESSFADEEVSFNAVERFLETLGLPDNRWPRDYQIKAFVKTLRKRRTLLLSPTASGKSLIIYLLGRWYDGKKLIIVPNKGLVVQMAGDFAEYGYKAPVHQIMSGVPKTTDHEFTVSTWQSIYKLGPEFFNQFELIVGDEAHGFKATCLKTIMEASTGVRHRVGTTGTLDGTQTHKLVLEGLFGQVQKVTTTSELMQQGHVAELNIKCLVLKYPAIRCQDMKGQEYRTEIKWLTESEARNRFIVNLAASLEGTSLCLFRYREHGQLLYELLKAKTEHPVYFIDGGVDAEDREEIRRIVNDHPDAKLVASIGTTATGTNIPNINNMIFCHPSKSKIQNLQSVGRGLRRSELKTDATLYDVADDLQWKSHKNHTLKHFLERVKIYTEEKFKYKVYQIELKNG
jgi:superfamily II DNA or RNA helicase